MASHSSPGSDERQRVERPLRAPGRVGKTLEMGFLSYWPFSRLMRAPCLCMRVGALFGMKLDSPESPISANQNYMHAHRMNAETLGYMALQVGIYKIYTATMPSSS